MEALIFALMVAGIAMRKSAADIPFFIRGKTPPSHQRRMREMDARDAAAARRQTARAQRAKARQRRRNTPARRYARGIWDHAWEQAAARREIRWQEKDPIKAEAYREKLRARAAGDLRGGFFPWAFNQSRRRAADATRRAFNAARDRYQQTKRRRESATTGAGNGPEAGSAAADTTATAAGGGAAGAARSEGPAEEEIWDAEVIEDRPDTAPEPEPVPETEPTAADSPYRDDSGAGRHETPALTAVPEPHHTKKGTNQMTTSGEVTGLTDALTLTESWERETGQAITQLEAAVASLEGAEVGPEVTGPFTTAMEAFTSAHEAFVQAKTGLQGSVNVGEAYQAAPGAGNKQFVTS